jgi:hypothetical protein
VDPADQRPQWKRLKELAEMTGGEMFRPSSIKQVGGVLERIAREIRHTYVIAYEPADVGAADGLRRIKVAVRPPDGRKLVVHTRAAYLVSSNDSKTDASSDSTRDQRDNQIQKSIDHAR